MKLNRRLFVSGGLVGAVSPVMLHAVPASAAGDVEAISQLSGKLFYTSEARGRWAGKEGGHAPMIERSANAIEITTGHEMDGYNHYIVKHALLDADLKFVTETMFDPEKDTPVSQHSIKGLSGPLYALSLCNKHDLWLTSFTL